MTSRPPGWYLIDPEEKFVRYWNGREFTGDVSGRFGQSFPVFDPDYVTPKPKIRWQDAKFSDDTPFAKAGRIARNFVIVVVSGFFLIVVVSCSVFIGTRSNDEPVEADPPTLVDVPTEAPVVEEVPVEPPPVVEQPPAPVTPTVNYANCDAVRAAGAAPIYPSDPGWDTKFDRDGDGIGCDS